MVLLDNIYFRVPNQNHKIADALFQSKLFRSIGKHDVLYKTYICTFKYIITLFSATTYFNAPSQKYKIVKFL
ncbi:hypothetical protein SAMN05444409_1529 [Epilithonimonas zeae]|uniref:Uncharacterized protein n=1 Tax=Epilithonimonas zeae TaxID=1416779 RepID=A0A1N6FXD8_9FLAO|nr:hypothetical protein SAMN05444409_1529 [Epilithonimonas zeae]